MTKLHVHAPAKVQFKSGPQHLHEHKHTLKQQTKQGDAVKLAIYSKHRHRRKAWFT